MAEETTQTPAAAPAQAPAPQVTPAAATPAGEPYFFPTHGKTVVATSQEEADEKLQALLNTK